MTTYKIEISIVKPELRDADGKIVSYKTEEEIYTQYVSELNVVDVVAVVNGINIYYKNTKPSGEEELHG